MQAIQTLIGEYTNDVIAQYDGAGVLYRSQGNSYRLYGLHNDWRTEPDLVGDHGQAPEQFTDAIQQLTQINGQERVDASTRFGREYFLYALPVDGDDGPLGTYVRITDEPELGWATQDGLGLLNLDRPAEANYPEGLSVHTDPGRMSITCREQPEVVIDHYGQVPLAVRDIERLQHEFRLQGERMEEDNDWTPPPFQDDTVEHFGSLETDHTLQGLLSDIERLAMGDGEFAMGWDTDHVPVTGQLFGPERSPKLLFKQPNLDSRSPGPARRVLNLIAAQALSRGLSVWAEDSLLSLCRGSTRYNRPASTAVSELPDWLDDQDGPVIAISNNNLWQRLSTLGILDAFGFLGGGRQVVFCGIRQTTDSMPDEDDTYTHVLRPCQPDTLSGYVALDEHEGNTTLTAPPLPFSPPVVTG